MITARQLFRFWRYRRSRRQGSCLFFSGGVIPYVFALAEFALTVEKPDTPDRPACFAVVAPLGLVFSRLPCSMFCVSPLIAAAAIVVVTVNIGKRLRFIRGGEGGRVERPHGTSVRGGLRR